MELRLLLRRRKLRARKNLVNLLGRLNRSRLLTVHPVLHLLLELLPRSGSRTPQPESPPQSQPAPQRARSTDAPAASECRLQELGEKISEGDLVRLMIA